MFAITPALAVYAAASYGYAIRCLINTNLAGRVAKHLLFFLLWNIIAALALRSLASFWLAQYGSGATIPTLTFVSMTPHILVLAGNVGNWLGAIRAGLDRPIVLLLGFWIAVSVFTIMLLGAISPVTYLINVLL